MYAVELETDANSRFVKIPEYENFKGKHLKVIFMSSDEKEDTYSVSQNHKIKQLFNKISEDGGIDIEDPVVWQNDIRSDRELH